MSKRVWILSGIVIIVLFLLFDLSFAETTNETKLVRPSQSQDIQAEKTSEIQSVQLGQSEDVKVASKLLTTYGILVTIIVAVFGGMLAFIGWFFLGKMRQEIKELHGDFKDSMISSYRDMRSEWSGFKSEALSSSGRLIDEWKETERRIEPQLLLHSKMVTTQADVMKQLGELQEKQDEIIWLEKMLKENPQLKEEKLTKKDLDKFKEMKERFLKEQENETWKTYGTARFYEGKKDYKIAREYIEKAEGFEHEDKDLKKSIFQAKGRIFQILGDQKKEGGVKDKAVENYINSANAYNEAIKIKDDFVAGYHNLAIVLIDLAKLNPEDKELEKIDFLKKIENGRGEKGENNGKGENKLYPEAIKCLNKIINELNPDNFEAYYDRGRVYVLQNGIPKAMKDFIRAFKLADLSQLRDLYKHIADDHTEHLANIWANEDFQKLIKRYEPLISGSEKSSS